MPDDVRHVRRLERHRRRRRRLRAAGARESGASDDGDAGFWSRAGRRTHRESWKRGRRTRPRTQPTATLLRHNFTCYAVPSTPGPRVHHVMLCNSRAPSEIRTNHSNRICKNDVITERNNNKNRCFLRSLSCLSTCKLSHHVTQDIHHWKSNKITEPTDA